MRSITVNERHISVSIIRSNRKTIQLKITSPTNIEARIPRMMTNSDVYDLLAKKQSWLELHIARFARLPAPTIAPPSLPPTLLFFGREIPIRLHTAPNITTFSVDHNDSSFTLSHPPTASAEEIRDAIIAYYRMTARTFLEEKTAHWSTHIGVTYNRITIKEQKTCWATCSSLKNLNYNWRIIQASHELIDYIVIHELCHLRHLNHSPAFWQFVSNFDPHYQEHKRTLKQIGPRLATSI